MRLWLVWDYVIVVKLKCEEEEGKGVAMEERYEIDESGSMVRELNEFP